MFKVLITTVPFAKNNSIPTDLLTANNISYVINPLGRKFKEEELADLIEEFDAIIAGTEVISENVLARAKKLKLISRVGIGLDGVDLVSAQRRGIKVSYTPDAPSNAVSELTLGLILSLLRSIHLANSQMHAGHWERFFGRRIGSSVIGIIGFGRIGSQVASLLKSFSPSKILINDVLPLGTPLLEESTEIKIVSKEEIYRQSDVISLHLPLTNKTHNMITMREMLMMKSTAILVNTSRGGIINELDLQAALVKGVIGGAAIDVFEEEPYNGPLNQISNCLLTSHMGSMSQDCRERMEIEASEEVIRFAKGYPLANLVPTSEYRARRTAL